MTNKMQVGNMHLTKLYMDTWSSSTLLGEYLHRCSSSLTGRNDDTVFFL